MADLSHTKEKAAAKDSLESSGYSSFNSNSNKSSDPDNSVDIRTRILPRTKQLPTVIEPLQINGV